MIDAKYEKFPLNYWPNDSFLDYIKGPLRSILTHLNLIHDSQQKVGNGAILHFGMIDG